MWNFDEIRIYHIHFHPLEATEKNGKKDRKIHIKITH